MKKLLVSVIALFGAVSLSAQDVTAIYNEAAAAFGAKNFTEAATKFEQVIDQGMDNESAASMVATAKSTLPKCYFMLGGGALIIASGLWLARSEAPKAAGKKRQAA